MLDIKKIRKEPDIYLKKISYRNTDINLNDLLDLDKKNRKIIQEKEKLEQEKKLISKNKDQTKYEKSKIISSQIENLEKSHIDIKQRINIIISSLPNIANDDVPVGKDESFNKEVNKIGKYLLLILYLHLITN